MRRLLLLRHANAAREGQADFDRPLSPRGRAEAAAMTREIAQRELAPALVLVSPAQRTRETMELVAPALGGADVEYSAEIYNAKVGTLLDLLRGLPDDADPVMVIGHNPALEELAALLARERPRESDPLASGLPTGALAILDMPGKHWSRLGERRGRLRGLLTPPAG